MQLVDLARLRADDGVDDVANRDEAHDAIVLLDDQMAHPLVGHHAHGLIHPLVGGDPVDVPVHHISDACWQEAIKVDKLLEVCLILCFIWSD